jgi:hypothetical protein
MGLGLTDMAGPIGRDSRNHDRKAVRFKTTKLRLYTLVGDFKRGCKVCCKLWLCQLDLHIQVPQSRASSCKFLAPKHTTVVRQLSVLQVGGTSTHNIRGMLDHCWSHFPAARAPSDGDKTGWGPFVNPLFLSVPRHWQRFSSSRTTLLEGIMIDARDNLKRTTPSVIMINAPTRPGIY